MYGLIEAVILAENEQDDEQHVHMVGALAATVMKLVQQWENLPFTVLHNNSINNVCLCENHSQVGQYLILKKQNWKSLDFLAKAHREKELSVH